MKKLLSVVVAFVVSMSLASVQSEEPVNRFQESLQAAGLSISDIYWPPQKLARIADNDPFRLYWFNELWSEPLMVPRITSQMSQRISLYGANKGNEINMYFFYGCVRTCGYIAAFLNEMLPPLPVAEKNPLTTTLREINYNHRLPWTSKIENQIMDVEKQLDQKTAMLLAKYLLAVEHLYNERKLIFENNCLDEDLFKKLCNTSMMDSSDLYRIGKDYDQKQMMWAICRAVFTIQEIKNSIANGTFKLPDKKLTLGTPFGSVTMNGTTKDDSYPSSNSCLIIDTNGNDTYTGSLGATSSVDNCSSVIIDISGNDTYLSKDKSLPSFGAGVLGLGMLVDLEGNDTYEGQDYTLGAGMFGAGLLYDFKGDDRYKAMYMCQGAASFGTGAIADFDGNDVYECYGYGQGYGYTKGFGVMYDKSGDDNYIANDTDIISPSAQNPKHNTSMAQGVGNGRRADYLDGKSMSGGCGMLVDDQGNDVYSCGVFGQGTAYWYGVGLFNDKAGNDTYKGLWYVQGATAHYAISEFKDDAGDDHYYTYQATSLGTGHDFSCSWHIDTGGNDVYDCWREEDGQKLWGGLMIGCGNETGFGFFVNIGGDDVYNAKSDNMFGGAYIASGLFPDGIRNEMLCMGYFIDIGGNDTYQKDLCKQNDKWIRINPDRPKIQVGIGVDAQDGMLGIYGIDK